MLHTIFIGFVAIFNYDVLFSKLLILLLTKLIYSMETGGFYEVYSHLFSFRSTKKKRHAELVFSIRNTVEK